MIRSGIPKARVITPAPAKHLGLIEHHTRYAEVVREFAYEAAAQMGEAPRNICPCTAKSMMNLPPPL